jgi:hypothetical protein
METLADIRNENPEQFDALIRASIHEAAALVGPQVVIEALVGE